MYEDSNLPMEQKNATYFMKWDPQLNDGELGHGLNLRIPQRLTCHISVNTPGSS